MSYIIKGNTGDWEVVIGLEVHAQVISNSKLFSGADTTFGAEPNSQVSFVDAGFPGMLPVINAKCVEQAVRTGLGLKAKINNRSVFARKNYFYADLPQGYQISQYELPIVGEGTLILDMPDGSTRAVGIERLHLEQDAGKSMHDQHPNKSLIDLNRSGVALMEIVSKPDMRTPEEAGAYLRKLRAILRYLGSCDGNMEEGSMRCDVNVSVRHPGEEFRTRCEIKNVNSVRFVMQAIEHEAARHVEVYESGGDIRQETRLFDPSRGETRSMRSKEQAHDYRYFPDPDLLPLEFDDAYVEAIRATLPELPDEKKERFISEYGITAYDATVLVMDQENSAFFETVAKGRDGKTAVAWVTTNLFGSLNKRGLSVSDSPVSATQLGQLIDLVADNTLSTRLAKDVFEIMMDEGKDPSVIVEERGMKQVTDTSAIEAACDQVIAANAEKADEVRNGKEKLVAWFVGQVMKATQGKANPAMLQEILKKKLLG
ncbi:Asp-tRNA(Asn)/Glu-tRNA(Gln) amidotransferase subunit GatB [Insolitispirillum peregrinum]|uniref:Aspartyl/glutamyl-tRNA(Asn/Gln) amidotransferase subunit B n=1 Tax=Insolitispirillum peregrinum TaxID=80876 RepID=A0A1N7NFV3_9PROT|nr:Asp-tRNA(Asn)/Glu-tRNA(Gln) amidotransferase subunit GatB [Insolitispirillum peregrinum]SIS97237.1 aspartyl/glutamyl-tRNA(Asn/Gln) amidotransferase subunit B [Insolitispirillum peregrinum]